MRPHGTADLLEWVFAQVPRRRAAAVGVEDLRGDRAIGRKEMVRRLHADELLGRKLDADLGEDFEPQGLGAMRDERHLDAVDADAGGVAERHLRDAEGLAPVALQSDHRDLGVDRLA